MTYQDVNTTNGVRHVTSAGESFLTFSQLALVKDLWRASDAWHPVDSLFTIIPELEKNFSTNVIKLTMFKGMDEAAAVQELGNIIMAATVK